jgi:hypothetical protein
MNLDKELYKVHNEINQINEGLVFFKDSERLVKLSKNIAIKAFKSAGEKGYKEVEDIVLELEKISNEFKELELKYKRAKKKERADVKSEYNILKTKFENLIKIINGQTYSDLVKAGFNFALIAAPLVFIFVQLQVVDSTGNIMDSVREAFAKTSFRFIALARVFQNVIKETGSSSLAVKTQIAIKNLEKKQIKGMEGMSEINTDDIFL